MRCHWISTWRKSFLWNLLVFLSISTVTLELCGRTVMKWILIRYSTQIQLAHHQFCPNFSLLYRGESGSESWGCGRDPSDFPTKSTWPSPWIGRGRIKVDVLSSWSPPKVLIRPSPIGKINSPCLGNITSFRIESFRVDFRCVHRLQLLKVCDHYVTLPSSPRVQSVSEEQSK